jgi:hypothetical protein
MKSAHQLSIATLVMAGFIATGCSQQQIAGGGSQQVAGGSQVQTAPVVATPEVKTVIKYKTRTVIKEVCSAKCGAKPKPRAMGGHTHPANRCTKTIRHHHKFNNRSHTHRYSCQGKRRHVGGNKWTHAHRAVPNCTDSFRHTHKFNSARHSHKYGCRGRVAVKSVVVTPTPTATKPAVDVYALQRKLKAKGYYRGPIDGIVGTSTRGALQRFMQNRR